MQLLGISSSVSSGDENHLCGVSLCQVKIFLKAHSAGMGPGQRIIQQYDQSLAQVIAQLGLRSYLESESIIDC